jgi:hypothetical protein
MSRHLAPRVVLVVVILWLGDVVVDAVELRLDAQIIPWGHFVAKRICLACFWILVTLSALHIYGQRPLALRARSLATTTLRALLVTVVYSAYLALVLAVAGSALSWWHGLEIAWPGDVSFGFFRCWLIVIGVTAYHAYRQGERLKAQLQQTELLLYRAQLEPHFMFNTLNSIASLVRLDRREAATDALHHLSSLLRGVLEVGQRQVMPWQWERDFAGTYITLQQLRFADRLDVHIDATDVPTHAPVPILLLQPLLENAIVHGPLADGRRCEITVRLRSAGHRLELRVENEVAQTAAQETHGVGLINMRARLTALFGDDCMFEHHRDGARFVVAAAFPLGAA